MQGPPSNQLIFYLILMLLNFFKQFLNKKIKEFSVKERVFNKTLKKNKLFEDQPKETSQHLYEVGEKIMKKGDNIKCVYLYSQSARKFILQENLLPLKEKDFENDAERII